MNENKAWMNENKTQMNENKAWMNENKAWMNENKTQMNENKTQMNENKTWMNENKTQMNENKTRGVSKGRQGQDDALNHSGITRGKTYSYQVCEDGTVIRTKLTSYEESAVKPFLRRGMAAVKVNGREYAVKNLVAKHFMAGYKPGAYVEVKNGDPFDCRVENLRMYTKSEHGKRIGHKGRARPVTANGKTYRSGRACAKALHVSHQTLTDYMAGRHKSSVLDGVDVRPAKGGGEGNA